MLAPIGLGFTKSIEELPNVLSKYAALLNYETIRPSTGQPEAGQKPGTVSALLGS